MKAIAFNGSARKDGNTAIMTGWLFDELEKEGIETELYQMIVPGSNYWNMCFGLDKGDVKRSKRPRERCALWDKTWPGYSSGYIKLATTSRT